MASRRLNKFQRSCRSAWLEDSLSSLSSFSADYANMSTVRGCNASLQSWTICSDTLLVTDDTFNCSTVSDVMCFNNISALCGDLRFIVGMPEMCDVRFLVGPQRVPVYGVKAILSTRSRIFYELLLMHQRKESQRSQHTKKRRSIASKLRSLRQMCSQPKCKAVQTNRQTDRHLTIEIDDFEPDIFKLIVLFLHCGKVDITISSIVGVMNAADAYGIEDLRSGCFRFAEKLLTVESVLPLLTSAERYIRHRWTKHLQEKIMEFISENAQDVLGLPEFVKISKRTVILIFTLPGLKATEERKWDAAYLWSRRYCRRREKNSFRRTMKIFARRINFMDIPVQKIIKEVRPLEIVSESVITQAITQQSSQRFVIGQEKPPMVMPLKPPRRRLGEKRSTSRHGSVRRRASSASSSSASSTTSSSSRAHSCDSGFTSSADALERM